MPNGHEARKSNEELTRRVELEMAAKRAEWQRNRDRFRKVRMLSFSFLSLLIVGTVIALLAMFSRVAEVRQERDILSPLPTISPHSPAPK